MTHLILIASGGATGAISRFLTTSLIKQYFPYSFYATLLINILGSFLIGYLVSVGYSKNISENFIKYFLIIGFLGSYTTFSAFSLEVVDLYLSGKFTLSFLYIIFSITLCILASLLGMHINKF